MDGWMDGWMYVSMYGCMDAWAHGWMYACIYVWMDESMDGRMDIKLSESIFASFGVPLCTLRGLVRIQSHDDAHRKGFCPDTASSLDALPQLFQKHVRHRTAQNNRFHPFLCCSHTEKLIVSACGFSERLCRCWSAVMVTHSNDAPPPRPHRHPIIHPVPDHGLPPPLQPLSSSRSGSVAQVVRAHP